MGQKAYGVQMKRSMQSRMFWSVLSVMLALILLVTFFSVRTTYQAMSEQLMDNKRMGIDWLSKRLDMMLSDYSNTFYSFEVNKTMKADIQNWCRVGGSLEYQAKWRIISELNALMGMDASIMAIDLFNLVGGDMLSAKRSGAVTKTTGEALRFWGEREQALQTNLVVIGQGDSLLLCHQWNRFETGAPLALMVLQIKPSVFENVLGEMRSPDENIFLLNDQWQLVSQSMGQDAGVLGDGMLSWFQEAGNSGETTAEDCYWFFRSLARGKLHIAQAVPRRVITDVINRNIMVGLLAAAGAVLAAIGFSLLFSRVVSKPIIALAEKMRHVTIRDYDAKSTARRSDEIGFLESSFDGMIARNQELIVQKFQTRIEKRSAQLRALQAQINPHFMYNTLQIIGGMALKKEAPEIYDITVSLSDIMRYSLSFGKEMVPLSEEMHYLECYLNIQSQRFGDRLHVHRQIDPELMDCLIPKLILQPIVENSLEHGLIGKNGQWEITLTGFMQDDDMHLAVADNGLGMTAERLLSIRRELEKGVENAIGSSAHIGLANVNSRIRLKYAGHYGLSIESTPKEGTRVEIWVPAQREE